MLLPLLQPIAWAGSFVIGSINNEPVEEIRQTTPMARYLADQLKPEGIDRVEVVVSPDMRHMADQVRDGRVDLFFDSPLPSLVLNALAGSRMVLRRWKHDVAEYASVVFVRRDSPLQTLADLRGGVVGFKDEYSSSGYLLPRIALAGAGLTLQPVASPDAPVETGQTGYLFTGGNENTIVWVVHGRIAAGAIAREELAAKAGGDRDRLRILHETPPIPRHVVNLRGDLPERLATAVTGILLRMDQTEAGREVLKRFERTTRFDPIPPDLFPWLEKVRPAVLSILGLS